MLQTFHERTMPRNARPRLAALRRCMASEGLDGFLVPRADAHQGEFVADADERLAWLTGFTGSAGTCLVLAASAALFVDSRYTLQAMRQLDPESFEVRSTEAGGIAGWLSERWSDGAALGIGYDPWLHTVAEISRLETRLESDSVSFVPTRNLVDAVWRGRPSPPMNLMVPHPDSLAGESHEAKRASVARLLRDAGQRSAVITAADSISWMLNTRGSDVERIPVAQAFAVIHDTGLVDLFMHGSKVNDALRSHLGESVSIRCASEFGACLEAMPGPIRVDRERAPAWVSERIGVGTDRIAYGDDPVLMPKACKNSVELAGVEAAHVRDGAALAEFLAWLHVQIGQSGLTEIDVVRKLEAFRSASGELRDISFDTICGSGPNGAIVHYRVTEETNREIQNGDVLLVDSGGQYADGTTDVTRTIAMGDPPVEAARAFTLVLKGMIAISMLRWPEGLAGCHIDAIARVPLWREGMDYGHGTGHGVGAFLAVHEGPQGISRRSRTGLRPGMIVSNEPGYYKEGHFGIRIENLLAVRKSETAEGSTGRKMLEFHTLTLAPIDRAMIYPDLLDRRETDWLDAYHADILDRLEPHCSRPAAVWLRRACAPLAEA